MSGFFRTPELRWVVIALSLSFIFGALRSVPGALMAREHRFRELALVEASRALTGPLVTVLLALAGAGYWSLVFGNLLGSCLWTLLLVRRRPVAFAWPRPGELRGVMTFSGQVLLSRTAWYAYSSSDFLVAGRLLGPSALGAYTYAWTLAQLAGEKVLSVVIRVTPGVMSAVSTDPAGLRRYLLALTELVTVAIWPLVGGLALVAPEFVPLVLGEQWSGVIVPLQLLAVYAAVQAMVTLMPQVLILTGQARYDMMLSLAALALFPPAFYVFGQRWGTVGIAAAWLVAYPVILAPLYARVLRTTATPVRLYLRALWPAASGTAVMAAAVLLVRAALPPHTPPGPGLALEVMAGAVAYVGCLFIQQSRLRALVALLRPAER